MSFENVPIPAAAEAAGMLRLTFADDFESADTVDMSGEGREGYLWFADRPFGRSTITADELEFHDSFLRLKLRQSGLSTYSCKGKTGFVMQHGYVEARIRMLESTDSKAHGPLFHLVGLKDFTGKPWADNGLLNVLEVYTTRDKQGERQPYYIGSVQHFRRSWEKDANGKPITRMATNFINSTGYRDWFTFLDNEWHTYAALWEPGHIAWYLDGKLMHSTRFATGMLPQHYYRDNPSPLPRIEERRLEFAPSTWPGAYGVFDVEQFVPMLHGSQKWPCDVDWVRIWQK